MSPETNRPATTINDRAQQEAVRTWPTIDIVGTLQRAAFIDGALWASETIAQQIEDEQGTSEYEESDHARNDTLTYAAHIARGSATARANAHRDTA